MKSLKTEINVLTDTEELLQSVPSKLPRAIATVSLFLALIPISLAPVLAKLCEREIGATAVAFHRVWMGTIIFGMISGFDLLRRQKSGEQLAEQKPFTKRELILLLLMGVAAAIYSLMWAWSLTEISVANVALLTNLNPLFVGLAGWILLGRRYNNRFLIGMVIALGGVAVFELDEVQFTTEQLHGDLLALLTAVFMATYLMLVERLRTRFSAVTILLWRCGVTTMLLLPALPFMENKLLPSSGAGWFFMIFQALFCQVLGQGLLAYSLNQLPSGLVSVTLLMEPVLASILAWITIEEKIEASDWVAFAVVLLGIYLTQSSQSAIKEELKDESAPIG